ncbi:MAG: SDR family NAD(P)-dependent oxidoreductase [Clostridia bacterium]
MKKVAFITGGARGIGKAISERFAKEGYNLIINYKENDIRAKEIKKQLEEKFEIEVMIIKTDLSKEESINNMIDEIYKKYSKIDVLVNNAGVVIDKEFTERSVDDWKETLSVNLIAPFVLTKLIGKKMYKEKSGVIINISSTNGLNTYYPLSVDYDASKSGLISLTYDSAVEFAPYVRVNCIAPGWVNTEMNKDLEENFKKEESERILVKRFGEPGEIANVVYFLASKEASFINSEVIKVDGGWY